MPKVLLRLMQLRSNLTSRQLGSNQLVMPEISAKVSLQVLHMCNDEQAHLILERSALRKSVDLERLNRDSLRAILQAHLQQRRNKTECAKPT